MRLQCRITPAEQELLNHLESVPAAYRAKRLIVLAAMYLSSSRKSDSAGVGGTPTQHESPISDERSGEDDGINSSRKPAAWITDAKL